MQGTTVYSECQIKRLRKGLLLLFPLKTCANHNNYLRSSRDVGDRQQSGPASAPLLMLWRCDCAEDLFPLEMRLLVRKPNAVSSSLIISFLKLDFRGLFLLPTTVTGSRTFYESQLLKSETQLQPALWRLGQSWQNPVSGRGWVGERGGDRKRITCSKDEQLLSLHCREQAILSARE